MGNISLLVEQPTRITFSPEIDLELSLKMLEIKVSLPYSREIVVGIKRVEVPAQQLLDLTPFLRNDLDYVVKWVRHNFPQLIIFDPRKELTYDVLKQWTKANTQESKL